MPFVLFSAILQSAQNAIERAYAKETNLDHKIHPGRSPPPPTDTYMPTTKLHSRSRELWQSHSSSQVCTIGAVSQAGR